MATFAANPQSMYARDERGRNTKKRIFRLKLNVNIKERGSEIVQDE